MRLVLAATLAANYGIYGPAFELLEHAPREPGSEEYLDSEKYEIKHWDLERADSLRDADRAAEPRSASDNPALQRDWSLRFHADRQRRSCSCYSKTRAATTSILVVVNLDPQHTQSGWVELDLERLGLDADETFEVHDLLAGARYTWSGRAQLRRAQPAHAAGARLPCHRGRRADLEPRSPHDAAGARRTTALWYKDAVIYQLHVKAFFDSNDDGIGDFRGLTSKLDYIQDLGVNAIWLLPFYPSPLKDDGYDIADYHNVHPQYGTRRGLQARSCARRSAAGCKVITELVINHTSDQHPWFQAARARAAGLAASATTTSGATPTRSTRARASSSPTPRRRTGPGTRWRSSTTGTASSATSPTSTSTTRTC